MRSKLKHLLLFFFAVQIVSAQVRLPKIISDGMVLQRNSQVKIWGWAEKNEAITVRFLDSEYKTEADSSGDWHIMLPKLEAGGPYDMQITASNTITIKDVLIGEVWVCSGQSNMELNMKRVSPLYPKEIVECENPNIRYFEVPDKYNFDSPQTDLSGGKWQQTNPDNILGFSAVSYFFGKELYDKYKVPIGLINAALGGSPAQSWISEDGLKAFQEYYKEALQ